MRKFIAALSLLLAIPVYGQNVSYYPVGPHGLEAGIVAISLAITTATTSAETMYSYTIPAGALISYPGFRVMSFADSANNANAKTFTLRFGAAGPAIAGLAMSVGPNTIGGIVADCFVATSSTIICLHNRTTAAGTNGMSASSLAFDPAVANTLIVQGTTPTAAGDLTLRSFALYFFRP